MLCVGLDPDPAKFPAPWRDDAARIFDFCAAIVDATHDLVIAFKPQIAYFAAQRAEDQLERLIAHIQRVAPDVPVILDAKRGDIGATAEQYAREAFERYRADAVTLSPFMGFDSIEPYLRHAGKGADPALPHLQPGRRRPAGAAPRSRGAACSTSTSPSWPQGRGTASGQLGLVVGATYPGRDRARARARADAAAADPRRRRAGRRRGGHGARRLARRARPDHRADHRQLVAGHALRRAATAPTSPRPRARAAEAHAPSLPRARRLSRAATRRAPSRVALRHGLPSPAAAPPGLTRERARLAGAAALLLAGPASAAARGERRPSGARSLHSIVCICGTLAGTRAGVALAVLRRRRALPRWPAAGCRGLMARSAQRFELRRPSLLRAGSSAPVSAAALLIGRIVARAPLAADARAPRRRCCASPPTGTGSTTASSASPTSSDPRDR